MRTAWLVVIILTTAGIAGAEDKPENRETLRGIEQIMVFVGAIAPGISSPGLSEPNIKTQVELRLRSHGIRVTENINVGYLSVSLQSVTYEESAHVYYITAAFKQPVITADQPGRVARVWAETWSSGSFGLVGSQRVDTLRDRLLEEVDHFINAYLSVNPKQ